LCRQFARAFGNDRFQALAPLDLVTYVIANHDEGWLEFDRDPAIDETTGLPYNLTETPLKYITVTSRLSPDFNQRHHPFTGLISSMHSWGLYNGRYGLSKLVLLDKVPAEDRPLTDKMLNGELDRQKRLKAELGKDPETAGWLEERKIFQNYKQLQFLDTLALYFNRIHPSERVEQEFENVPMDTQHDISVVIRPEGGNVYTLTPFPFVIEDAEFAFAGRLIEPGLGKQSGGWPAALRKAPTRWEYFRLAAS
jgi:hypothetical protein